MSAIKDLYELGRELKERVSDRKTLELIMPILDKIQEADRENLQVEHKQLELDRKLHDQNVAHFNEISKLKESHSKIVADLEAKISSLESKPKHFVGTTKLQRG